MTGEIMKISSISEDNYLIFLNKERYTFPPFDKRQLSKYLKDILQKIKKFYNISLHGYYEIEIYQDSNYGSIFEMNKISDDYFDLFNKKMELQILCHEKESFLYEIEDLEFLQKFQKNYDAVYEYKNHYYISFQNLVRQKIYYQFLEHTRIVYGEEKEKIIKNGNILFQNKKSSCIMKLEG